MNPIRQPAQVQGNSLPRTRGDEPGTSGITYRISWLYPAHAGMNPLTGPAGINDFALPRTRGDEPKSAQKCYA